MGIIALMKCTGIDTYEGNFKGKVVVAGRLKLECQYSGIESLREYCNATPSGNMELSIENPEAMKQLTPGKHYTVTIDEIQVTG